ncbi:UbiA prenyltransferase family-domain-containing protein [Schizophyllum commune]
MVEQTWELCKVLALFIKSDLLCSICPAALLALGLAKFTSFLSLCNGLVWVTLHVLVCVIIGVEEDCLVKPHQPIVSGSITLDNAVLLHRGIVVASLCFSATQQTLPLSIVYVLGTTAYNDGHLSHFWLLKSLMTGFGIVMCSWGTAVCFADGRPLLQKSFEALFLFALLLTTTIHAQDFRDRVGDLIIGRKTLPIILPSAVARWMLGALIFVWSTVLLHFWLPPATTVSLQRNDTQEADRRSCAWYNAWITVCLGLPLVHRLGYGGA